MTQYNAITAIVACVLMVPVWIRYLCTVTGSKAWWIWGAAVLAQTLPLWHIAAYLTFIGYFFVFGGSND